MLNICISNTLVMNIDKPSFDDVPKLLLDLIEKVSSLEAQLQKSDGVVSSHPEIMTIEQAADYLGVSKQTLYNKVHKRQVPHIKKDGLLRFGKKQLKDYMESGMVNVDGAYSLQVKPSNDYFFSRKKTP